jgi:hypothetical protein
MCDGMGGGKFDRGASGGGRAGGIWEERTGRGLGLVLSPHTTIAAGDILERAYSHVTRGPTGGDKPPPSRCAPGGGRGCSARPPMGGIYYRLDAHERTLGRAS